MTDVLQCPYCYLRFTSRSELEQHKAFDHPGREQEQVPPAAEPAEESPQPPTEEGETSAPPEKRSFLSRLFGRG